MGMRPHTLPSLAGGTKDTSSWSVDLLVRAFLDYNLLTMTLLISPAPRRSTPAQTFPYPRPLPRRSLRVPLRPPPGVCSRPPRVVARPDAPLLLPPGLRNRLPRPGRTGAQPPRRDAASPARIRGHRDHVRFYSSRELAERQRAGKKGGEKQETLIQIPHNISTKSGHPQPHPTTYILQPHPFCCRHVTRRGHSTGAQDAVRYALRSSSAAAAESPEPRAPLLGVVLQAGCSDREYAETLPETAANLELAQSMVRDGKVRDFRAHGVTFFLCSFCLFPAIPYSAHLGARARFVAPAARPPAPPTPPLCCLIIIGRGVHAAGDHV